MSNKVNRLRLFDPFGVVLVDVEFISEHMSERYTFQSFPICLSDNRALVHVVEVKEITHDEVPTQPARADEDESR